MERDSLLHTLEAVDKQPVVDDLVSERFFAAWPLERLFGQGDAVIVLIQRLEPHNTTSRLGQSRHLPGTLPRPS
jgi:hypothetical protein